MNYCLICNSLMIETKVKDIFICSNCFHITNFNETNIKSCGNICILQKKEENKNYMWVNFLQYYKNPHLGFNLINDVKKEYEKEFNSLFIQLPYINGKLSCLENYNSFHYFNINSMKILCELYNFNIIDLYKVNKLNELFYVFELQNKNEEHNNKNFDIYKHIYDELTNNLYDICSYV